jgi:hypothetical protein
MAQIICPKCDHKFDSNNAESFVTRAAAAGLGAVVGDILGIPGAVVGGLVGWFGADRFRRCPICSHIFKRKRP